MANLFIPFQIRTQLETKRRELEQRIRGTYQGSPEMVKLFEAIDQDLLDLLEMINMILHAVDVQDETGGSW